MARSIGYQFENAINSQFGKNGEGGFDKHSMRANKIDTTDKVFSYKEREALIKVGYQFGKYLKENYPEVKKISDIRSEHTQGFLNSKANTNNKNSLGTVKSNLNKLDKVSSVRYGSKTESFMNEIKTPETVCKNNIRGNVSASKEEWAKIEKEMQGSSSKANDLIRLAKEYGLRVESLTNLRACDFDFKNKTIKIVNDKGKRDRVLKMTNVEICKKVVGVKTGNDKITKMRPSSINRQFGRMAQKAGITKFKDAKTGIHALRKSRACELARELKDKGFDREKILSEVSRFLGHGTTRRDVLKKYLDEDTIEYIS